MSGPKHKSELRQPQREAQAEALKTNARLDAVIWVHHYKESSIFTRA
jgi:hypothetical protein